MQGNIFKTNVDSQTRTPSCRTRDQTRRNDSTVPIVSTTYWSDTTDVMCWINSSKRKYRPYVAIRITEILSKSKITDCRWVPGKMNPADLATKPIINTKNTQEIWLNGPPFLRRDESDWPVKIKVKPDNSSRELVKILHIKNDYRKYIKITGDPIRISNWLKLVRVTAWTIRITRHLFRKLGPLDREEIINAEFELYKEAQRGFSEERKLILNGKRIPKSSELHRFSVFIDPKDPYQLLRLKSRLMKSKEIPYTTRVPIFMPKNDMITRRIVQFYHEITGHQNHQTTLNLLKRQFVIVSIQSLLNKVIRNCQSCAIYLAKPETPEMAALPLERLDYGCRPFANIGLDCFGPFKIGIDDRHKKVWGFLTMCLTTRAIQVDFLESLHGTACVDALTIFSNQWKVPKTIRCDNATNFVWASKNFIGRKGECPTWKFNPPLAPHMGGSWERVVRTIKSTLSRIQIPENMTLNKLRLFMSHVVDIVNSRPLTHVSVESEDSPSITPNHFLRPCMSEESKDNNIDLLGKHLENQDLLKKFWKKWSDEYLPTISVRSKWRDHVEPLNSGDLVIFKNDWGWTRGRIEEVFSDPESGQSREVTIYTKDKIYRRAVTQVAKLRIVKEY